MKNNVKNLIEFIDHCPSCFSCDRECKKTVSGTWFYGIKRERILGSGGRKELLCYEKRKFYHSISFAKEGFSRVSHRGKPQ